jgi:hypothetical protein
VLAGRERAGQEDRSDALVQPVDPAAQLLGCHIGAGFRRPDQSADGGRFRLTVPGASNPVVIPLTEVGNVAIVTA